MTLPPARDFSFFSSWIKERDAQLAKDYPPVDEAIQQIPKLHLTSDEPNADLDFVVLPPEDEVGEEPSSPVSSGSKDDDFDLDQPAFYLPEDTQDVMNDIAAPPTLDTLATQEPSRLHLALEPSQVENVQKGKEDEPQESDEKDDPMPMDLHYSQTQTQVDFSFPVERKEKEVSESESDEEEMLRVLEEAQVDNQSSESEKEQVEDVEDEGNDEEGNEVESNKEDDEELFGKQVDSEEEEDKVSTKKKESDSILDDEAEVSGSASSDEEALEEDLYDLGSEQLEGLEDNDEEAQWPSASHPYEDDDAEIMALYNRFVPQGDPSDLSRRRKSHRGKENNSSSANFAEFGYTTASLSKSVDWDESDPDADSQGHRNLRQEMASIMKEASLEPCAEDLAKLQKVVRTQTSSSSLPPSTRFLQRNRSRFAQLSSRKVKFSGGGFVYSQNTQTDSQMSQSDSMDGEGESLSQSEIVSPTSSSPSLSRQPSQRLFQFLTKNKFVSK